MARKFCTKCETLHDGPCSVAALARVSKSAVGGKCPPSEDITKAPAVRASIATKPSPPLSGKPIPSRGAADPTNAHSVPTGTSGISRTKSDRLAELEAKLMAIDAQKAIQREKTRLRVAAHRARKKGEKQ